MRKRFPNIVRVLLALALVAGLVAITAAPASAQPIFTTALSPTAAPVGASVTLNIVTLDGFAADSILAIKFDGATVTTAPAVVKTDSTSNVTCALLVPTAMAGPHQITASDGVTTVGAPNNFTVQSKVTIFPTFGTVGSSATVTGTGFGAGVSAQVTIGTFNFGAVQTTDSVGGFTSTGTIPALLTAGAQTVTATDGAGYSSDPSATPIPGGGDAAFTVKPTLALSPSSGLAGSLVTISGAGWAPGPVAVTFAGGTFATVTADAQGVISVASQQIPPAATPGVKQVVGTDSATPPPNIGVTTFNVLARPLTLNPNTGPMGTRVLVTGSNMTPDTVLKPSLIDASELTFGAVGWNTGAPQPGAITIDTTGTISPSTLTVPPGSVLGANTVLARDNGVNGLTADLDDLFAQGTFTVTRPTLSLTPATGPKGSSVTITGSGWVPNNAVTITFGVGGPQLVTTPDAIGDIAAAMNVPATATPGANPVTASDLVLTALGNSALPATFTVPPAAVKVDPVKGTVGSDVTISGTGFAGYTPIQITFGGYTFPTQSLSDPLGAFTFSAIVPGIAPGSQAVSAFDGTSTATTFFTITAAPTTVATALASISGCLVRVWGYYDGEWQMYDPADPVGSDLTSLTAGRGYWVKVNADCTLIYGGNSWDLTTGWNLIGWR